ncbi:MAG TPA: ATP-binding cassette domain-containing protein [Bacilli bacterium]|nr:ATP-binding cassette domain-containing protein [Bacilli bacterium]
MEKRDIIIELNNVSKEFDGKTVVDNFNLYINRGEFVTFLGPSGCGKTTTLRMIAGFELPTKGKIILNGKDISHLPPYKRPVNTVFQRYALFPHLDVYDNIAFGLKIKKIKALDKSGKEVLRKLTNQEIDDKVVKSLKMVDLEQFEDRDISTLSGGQQQRVAIARAIVNEPEIILLDEPLGALDLKMRKEMQLELKEIHRKLGLTFIYVTHDQEEALTMSDTIVVMNDGVIQQIGTPMDIYNEPQNAFVANFIGESNIYNGRMSAKEQVRFLGSVFTCVDDFPRNEKVDVIVRPEDVEIVRLDKGMVVGKIVNKIFKGVHYEYTIMVGKNEVIAQDTKDHKVDKEVGIFIEPENIHIMKSNIIANVYKDAWINKNNQVVIGDNAFDCDVTQLKEGAKLDEEGYLVTADGQKFDLNDVDVTATIELKDIEISDNLDEGDVVGDVLSIIYMGDHYQVMIRTDDEEDFVLNSEYLWNEDDRVALKISPNKIGLKLKGELKNNAN